MSDQLTELEKLAAQMFFNVSVQSAFAREDPNVRFIVEFKRKDEIGYKGALQIADVENRTYKIDVGEGRAVFEANPPESIALSRVLLWGGRAPAVIDAVLAGCRKSAYFKLEELPPRAVAEGVEAPEGAGNRFIRLVTNDDLEATHDVACMFAWGFSSDKGFTLELTAWPITKNAEF